MRSRYISAVAGAKENTPLHGAKHSPPILFSGCPSGNFRPFNIVRDLAHISVSEKPQSY